MILQLVYILLERPSKAPYCNPGQKFWKMIYASYNRPKLSKELKISINILTVSIT